MMFVFYDTVIEVFILLLCYCYAFSTEVLVRFWNTSQEEAQHYNNSFNYDLINKHKSKFALFQQCHQKLQLQITKPACFP